MVADVAGRIVRRVAHGPHVAGLYSTRWDGRDELGQSVPRGRYFVLLFVARQQQDVVAIDLSSETDNGDDLDIVSASATFNAETYTLTD